MNITLVLSQALGIIFIVFGLSMIFNKKWMVLVVDEIVKNQGLLWLAGLVALMMGVVIVLLNNVWTSGLPLFVTVLGWLTLLKGAVILLFPNLTVSYYKKMNKGNILMWGGVIVF